MLQQEKSVSTKDESKASMATSLDSLLNWFKSKSLIPKSANFKQVFAVLSLLVVVAGTASAYFLNDINQDIRQQASTGLYPQVCCLFSGSTNPVFVNSGQFCESNFGVVVSDQQCQVGATIIPSSSPVSSPVSSPLSSPRVQPARVSCHNYVLSNDQSQYVCISQPESSPGECDLGDFEGACADNNTPCCVRDLNAVVKDASQCSAVGGQLGRCENRAKQVRQRDDQLDRDRQVGRVSCHNFVVNNSEYTCVDGSPISSGQCDPADYEGSCAANNVPCCVRGDLNAVVKDSAQCASFGGTLGACQNSTSESSLVAEVSLNTAEAGVCVDPVQQGFTSICDPRVEVGTNISTRESCNGYYFPSLTNAKESIASGCVGYDSSNPALQRSQVCLRLQLEGLQATCNRLEASAAFSEYVTPLEANDSSCRLVFDDEVEARQAIRSACSAFTSQQAQAVVTITSTQTTISLIDDIIAGIERQREN